MKKLYEVLAGYHFEDGNKHSKGQTVVSSRNLTKLFPGKFKDLGRAPDANDTVSEDVKEEAPKTEVPSTTKPETEQLPPPKTDPPKAAKKKKAAKKVVKKKDNEWDD